MDEPLGNRVGNFLEVEESLDCLEGKGPGDLMEVTLELGARMAVLGGKAPDATQGRRLCEKALAGGRPRELFLRNIESQGGDLKKFLELRGRYRSPLSAEIRAREGGYISRIDAWKIGSASVLLGVGRNRTEDPVSPTAGIAFHAKRGDRVAPGEGIMTVWAATPEGLEAALGPIEGAVEYSPEAPPPRKLVLRELGPKDRP
jgi:pyrimidine-nucleoside phosphorylase